MMIKSILVGALALLTLSATGSADFNKWADLTDKCLAESGAPMCFVADDKKIFCPKNLSAVAEKCSRQANDALRPARLSRKAADQVDAPAARAPEVADKPRRYRRD
mgnify:CR=1 FL=1